MENTQRIADLCQVEFQFGTYHLPEFKLPEGWTDGDAYFEKLCLEGFARRYPDQPPEYLEQLEYEMAMIRKMGFVDYFLIVSDFIGYAKRQQIPVGPGRGSAAGSMVSYCLDITDVDPLKYGLYFERFLNPERVTMPDIDIDFCIRRRQEVIDYVCRKYGADHVAQIVTFGTMAARGAIRDVGRALNVPYAEVDQIAKQVPSGPGALHITLDEALKLSKPLRDLLRGGPAGQAAHRHRPEHRGDAPPRLHPRRRRGHHPPAGGRLCPPGEERRVGGHPVYHDHPGGAWPAEDGLFGPAEPDGAGRRGEAGAAEGARPSTSAPSRTTTRRCSRCSPRGRPPACSRWSPPA